MIAAGTMLAAKRRQGKQGTLGLVQEMATLIPQNSDEELDLKDVPEAEGDSILSAIDSKGNLDELVGRRPRGGVVAAGGGAFVAGRHGRRGKDDKTPVELQSAMRQALSPTFTGVDNSDHAIHGMRTGGIMSPRRTRGGIVAGIGDRLGSLARGVPLVPEQERAVGPRPFWLRRRHTRKGVAPPSATSRVETSGTEAKVLVRIEALRDKIYFVLEGLPVRAEVDPPWPRIAAVSAIVAVAMISLSSLALAVSTLYPAMKFKAVRQGVLVTEAITIAYFVVDYAVRLATSRNRWRWVRRLSNMLDLCMIIPFFLELAISPDPEASDVNLSALGAVRVVRLTRIVRVAKLSRHSGGLKDVVLALTSSRAALSLLAVLLMVAMLIFPTLMFYAEQTGGARFDQDRREWIAGNGRYSPFQSVFHGMWWCVVTMTTVGYGDDVPATHLGQAVAVLTMLTGVLAIGFPTVILSAAFHHAYTSRMLISTVKEVAHKEKIKVEARRRARGRTRPRSGAFAAVTPGTDDNGTLASRGPKTVVWKPKPEPPSSKPPLEADIARRMKGECGDSDGDDSPCRYRSPPDHPLFRLGCRRSRGITPVEGPLPPPADTTHPPLLLSPTAEAPRHMSASNEPRQLSSTGCADVESEETTRVDSPSEPSSPPPPARQSPAAMSRVSLPFDTAPSRHHSGTLGDLPAPIAVNARDSHSRTWAFGPLMHPGPATVPPGFVDLPMAQRWDSCGMSSVIAQREDIIHHRVLYYAPLLQLECVRGTSVVQARVAKTFPTGCTVTFRLLLDSETTRMAYVKRYAAKPPTAERPGPKSVTQTPSPEPPEKPPTNPRSDSPAPSTSTPGRAPRGERRRMGPRVDAVALKAVRRLAVGLEIDEPVARRCLADAAEQQRQKCERMFAALRGAPVTCRSGSAASQNTDPRQAAAPHGAAASSTPAISDDAPNPPGTGPAEPLDAVTSSPSGTAAAAESDAAVAEGLEELRACYLVTKTFEAPTASALPLVVVVPTAATLSVLRTCFSALRFHCDVEYAGATDVSLTTKGLYSTKIKRTAPFH